MTVQADLFYSIRSPVGIRYLEMDCRRIAEQYGIPFRIWPHPDPIVQDMDTLEIAGEQPSIHRLTRLMQYAVEQNAGYEFTLQLATLIWDGKTDDWHLGNHMALAAEAAGQVLTAMDSAIEANPEHYDAAIDDHQNALARAGHWGVPTIVYNGEPFFG